MRKAGATVLFTPALLAWLLLAGSPFTGGPAPSAWRAAGSIAYSIAYAEEAPVLLQFSELYSGASVFGLVFSERLLSLAGKKVAMSGFMAPPIKPDLDFFVLTRTPMALCPFCSTDADWPDDIVFVRMRDGRTVRPTDRPVRVEGTLEVGSKVDEATGFVSLVRILADDVRILRPGEVLE